MLLKHKVSGRGCLKCVYNKRRLIAQTEEVVSMFDGSQMTTWFGSVNFVFGEIFKKIEKKLKFIK